MYQYMKATHYGLMLVAAWLLSACASVGNPVRTPEVSLRAVQMTEFSLSSQTFLLSFDVINPNPFALPVRTVKYAVSLDGQSFASGNAAGNFSVPASGDGTFSISASLDLLHTAPKLLSIVRAGARRDIPYEIKGQLGVDIPFARPVSFSHSGEIRLRSSAF